MNQPISILLIDDDPMHLDIYKMIVETIGFTGLPVLVSECGLQIPDVETIHAVLLDYRLAPNISAYAVVQQLRDRYPAVPILILSDMYEAPADTAPFVQGFVRKGNPELLLSTLRDLVENSQEQILAGRATV